MQSTTFLNLIGLILNMGGAFLVFAGTPPVKSKVYLYYKAEQNAIDKKDRVLNQRVRYGMFIMFCGFLAQIIALLINQ